MRGLGSRNIELASMRGRRSFELALVHWRRVKADADIQNRRLSALYPVRFGNEKHPVR